MSPRASPSLGTAWPVRVSQALEGFGGNARTELLTT